MNNKLGFISLFFIFSFGFILIFSILDLDKECDVILYVTITVIQSIIVNFVLFIPFYFYFYFLF